MIRRILSALIAAALVLTIAGSSQGGYVGPRRVLMGGKPAVVVSYIGPGDVVSGATAFYGLRAYNKAYATGTNNAILILRASDSTTKNIVILATGALDVATATAFCLATTCSIQTWYDQLGTYNVTQATAANQPALTFNCIGSLPCATFTAASSQQLLNASFVNTAAPNTWVAVTERTASFTSFMTPIGSDNFSQIGFLNSANTVYLSCGSTQSVTASDSVLHSIIGVCNGASGSLNIDGTLTSGLNAGSNPNTTQISLGSRNTANFLQGIIAEAAAYNGSAMSTTNQTALCHNQRLYYGLGGSC